VVVVVGATVDKGVDATVVEVLLVVVVACCCSVVVVVQP
jgi:hypothetical protein